eukprot:5917116-Prymnesium_polylepis.1
MAAEGQLSTGAAAEHWHSLTGGLTKNVHVASEAEEGRQCLEHEGEETRVLACVVACVVGNQSDEGCRQILERNHRQ